MVCGTFARSRLSAAQAAEVAQGYRDNIPPPDEVRTTVVSDGTFTVTALFPPCRADTTHDTNTSGSNQQPPSAPATPVARSAPPAASTGASGSPGDFGSLVPGGFFSSQPNDTAVPRSIRCNNPGALNISDWQRSRKGFVGVTGADGSSNKNQTTIYRTPEHGVASWWHLLGIIYGLSAKTRFHLLELAQHYSGQASGRDVDDYVNGWIFGSGGALTATTNIDINLLSDARILARAMYAHEAGRPSPLHDNQIDFGINNEMMNTLPS